MDTAKRERLSAAINMTINTHRVKFLHFDNFSNNSAAGTKILYNTN